jgi:hypothetical protein
VEQVLPRGGEEGEEVLIMHTHVRKCKYNKVKILKQ